MTTTDPSYLAWRQWQRDHPLADAAEVWQAAYHEGERHGVRQSVHLGVSVLVQQLSTVTERLERTAAHLSEDEIASPYWQSDG